jgi:hypothetical protein
MKLIGLIDPLSSLLRSLAGAARPRRPGGLKLIYVLVCAVLVTGCTLNMREQPKFKPLEPSDFYADGRSARPLLENTVAQGQLRLDTQLYQGKNEDGSYVEVFPFEVTPEVMDRGRERYDIFCSPCHGRRGTGEGMIVLRGFKQPPSFHIDRLRDTPVGYYYDVITNGFGTMYSYAARVEPEDRWAIIAYIRALQLSQNATLSDVPPDERDNLLTGPER